MSIQNTIKNKVNKDWLQAFPELAAYGANRFYKISEPTSCVISIYFLCIFFMYILLT